jgi:aminopeptidase N
MSQAPSREPTLLADYRPPAYLTPAIELDFVLEPEATLVTARQRFRRNPEAGETPDELVLFGEDQELLALRVDGAPVPATG